MYKITDLDGNSLCVSLLCEVRDMTGATDEQIKKLSHRHFLMINGFAVANYTR